MAGLIGTAAFLFWTVVVYRHVTNEVPEYGGEYTEGMVSQPRYVNPLLSQTSQADEDLVTLIYSGLFGHDANGNVVPDMADHYDVSDDGKTYKVYLKDGITWHDGEPFSADDVIFTIKTLQDPTYKSPLRQNWLGVEVSSEGPNEVTFTLKKSYFAFLETLTLGILPKHVWENVSSEKFLLAESNLKPVGTGPYEFVDFEQDSSGNVLSYKLRSNQNYYKRAPYIDRLTFYFYEDQAAVLDAYNKKEISGIYNVKTEDEQSITSRKGTQILGLDSPRMFGLFWNVTKSVPLADAQVREALSYAIDRQQIVQGVLNGEGQPAYSPILPFMTGYVDLNEKPVYNQDTAKKLLDEAGWTVGSDGVREKGGQKLAFEVLTPDWPELVATSDRLKQSFAAIGVQITVKVEAASDLQQNELKNRDYQAVLFGQAAMLESDPFSFWHSSQKSEGGLNIAVYDNSEADATLENLRTATNENDKLKDYKDFQVNFFKNNPALFLYTPKYLYVVNSNIKGIETTKINSPSGRLANLPNWYIKTRRVFR